MASMTDISFRSWQIGDIKVTRIVESESVFDIPTMFPKASAEEVQKLDWLKPHFVTDDWQGKLSIHALVVETPELTIVVDTCIGNDRDRLAYETSNNLQTAFMQDFEAAGFDREKVDVVLCTHLHFDHVGWNTMKVGDAWVPTFPNARYLFNRAEFEYWRDTQDEATEDMFLNVQKNVFIDSVKPVIDAGLVDLVDENHRVSDEVWLEPTPGHSPGHVCIRLRSQGQDAFITGDMVHHPFQFANAEWSMASVDYDSDMATATRARVYGEVADQPVLVIGTHFAGVTAGRVRKDGASYRFDAEE
ncbi:MAG: MBL fold metallo-hydrolase [Novosphingobium sp.]|nr:MBL fold metallo-hydrolase [Novosphingobium sp.]